MEEKTEEMKKLLKVRSGLRVVLLSLFPSLNPFCIGRRSRRCGGKTSRMQRGECPAWIMWKTGIEVVQNGMLTNVFSYTELCKGNLMLVVSQSLMC